MALSCKLVFLYDILIHGSPVFHYVQRKGVAAMQQQFDFDDADALQQRVDNLRGYL
jgi:hypothetical protein